MTILRSLGLMLGASVAVLLYGCGEPMSGAPNLAALPAGNLVPAQARALGLPAAGRSPLRADRRASWMSPDAKKSSLLYVADEDTDDVTVYSYPKGKLEGTLTGFDSPSGLCSGKNGDVFVLNGNGTTVEVFAHAGTSPIRTLALGGPPELNCAVDPKTGNLALGVLVGGSAEIAVFADASGMPTTYQPADQDGIPGCAYDDHSNLFCDAYGSGNVFALFELAKGSSNVASVNVSGASGLHAGPMQWDGTDVTFGSGASGTIYRIAVSGSSGSVNGSTQLSGTGWVWQYWIRKSRLIAPTYAGSSSAEVGYFPYPAGGSPTKTITGFEQPDGATISVGK